MAIRYRIGHIRSPLLFALIESWLIFKLEPRDHEAFPLVPRVQDAGRGDAAHCTALAEPELH